MPSLSRSRGLHITVAYSLWLYSAVIYIAMCKWRVNMEQTIYITMAALVPDQKKRMNLVSNREEKKLARRE